MIREYRQSERPPGLSDDEWALAILAMYRSGAGGRTPLTEDTLAAFEAVARQADSQPPADVHDAFAVAGWLALLFENLQADDA